MNIVISADILQVIAVGTTWEGRRRGVEEDEVPYRDRVVSARQVREQSSEEEEEGRNDKQ